MLSYLRTKGFEFQEQGSPQDIQRMIGFFVENGFVDNLEVKEAEQGHDFIWKNLLGADAYKELGAEGNPFMACPLNACATYIADKHGMGLKLHRTEFRGDEIISQEELVAVES